MRRILVASAYTDLGDEDQRLSEYCWRMSMGMTVSPRHHFILFGTMFLHSACHKITSSVQSMMMNTELLWNYRVLKSIRHFKIRRNLKMKADMEDTPMFRWMRMTSNIDTKGIGGGLSWYDGPWSSPRTCFAPMTQIMNKKISTLDSRTFKSMQRAI